MKAIQLRSYQMRAVDAIQEALSHGQKHIVVEMVTGSGKSLVLAKTAEMLLRQNASKVLVVTNRLELKENIEHNLFDRYQDFAPIDKNRIAVTTEQSILRHANEELTKYPFVIFDESDISEPIYKSLRCEEKTTIIFSSTYTKKPHRLFTPSDVVFSYSYDEAIKDGVLTPAMDSLAFEPAVVAFSKSLLEQYGYGQIVEQDSGWDLSAYKANQKIWVDYKTYKSQAVSPSAANSLLSFIVMRKIRQSIPQNETVLLIVLSRIPSFQKDVIFNRYRIIVLDIDNLVYYSKNVPMLLKQLSRITYFPIDHIEGQPSAEAESSKLLSLPVEDKYTDEAEKEATETIELIQCLNDCKVGQKHSREYEEICEKILRTLFEANYFNKLRNQYKTEDKHFRMDLIGSLKINQSNEESMHPLWQTLVQHYNSHFVVFEFKNYSKEIDQNLIYTTEKYLYDTALRNVAIIVSRKGFSKSAKFAAEGCLKEHGKLILNITDNDLIKMLELKSDKAADYILDKLEEFLMRISK